MEPRMSTLLWSLAKENPWPGLALASLNLVVALSLVGLSLLLGVTISLLAGLHAFVGERSWITPKGLQRGSGALWAEHPSCQCVRAAQSILKLPCWVTFCGSAERCSCCSLQPIPCCPRPRRAGSSKRILHFRRSE